MLKREVAPWVSEQLGLSRHNEEGRACPLTSQSSRSSRRSSTGSGSCCETEIYPLEVLDLDHPQLLALVEPLREKVKAQQLFAPHLDPELGGQGFGQVKLGLIHELLGRSRIAPLVFGCQAPDSGNSEILALARHTTSRKSAGSTRCSTAS